MNLWGCNYSIHAFFRMGLANIFKRNGPKEMDWRSLGHTNNLGDLLGPWDTQL